MRKQTEIWSIFSQIEEVVAQAMVDEGVVNKIRPEDIPPTALYNDRGEKAKFAIVIQYPLIQEFNRRVADLRA
jgi:hypothetical protein